MRFARSGDFDVMMLAGRYSLLEQVVNGILPLALEKKIAVMLAGVFNSGILATGAKPGAFYNYKPAPPREVLARVARIEAVCASHGVALPQAALAFCAAHPAVATIVLGAVAPQEVARNLDLVARPVPAALWRDLQIEGLLAEAAPIPET